MEKNRIILTVVATLLVLFASCNTSSKDLVLEENQVKFDTLVVEKRQYLLNDTASPFCDLNVHFTYPVTSSETDVKRLQKVFIRNTFGQEYIDFVPEEAIEQYTKTFLKNYEGDARIFQKELQDLAKPSVKLRSP